MKKLKAAFIAVSVASLSGLAALALPGSASAHSYNGYANYSHGHGGHSWSRWHNADYTDDNQGHRCQDDESDGTIVDALTADGRFTTLLAAVKAAGLEDALNAPGDKTLFAPTDDAFAALPAGTVDGLLQDIPALTNILTYHVVDGDVDAEDALNQGQLTTLNGQTLQVTQRDDGAYINNTKLLATDMYTDNGIIHVIGGVLTPQS